MKYIEKHNGNQIKEIIKDEIAYIKEDNKAYCNYDIDNSKNFYLVFREGTNIKLMIDYFDLIKGQYDSRQTFMNIRQINEGICHFVLLDFNKNHDREKKPHLNVRRLPAVKNDKISRKIDCLNHLPIKFSKRESFELMDHFETFISALVALGENHLFTETDECGIYQLRIDSNEYMKIKKVLSKYTKVKL